MILFSSMEHVGTVASFNHYIVHCKARNNLCNLWLDLRNMIFFCFALYNFR
jgi:hypothetical protein